MCIRDSVNRYRVTFDPVGAAFGAASMGLGGIAGRGISAANQGRAEFGPDTKLALGSSWDTAAPGAEMTARAPAAPTNGSPLAEVAQKTTTVNPNDDLYSGGSPWLPGYERLAKAIA